MSATIEEGLKARLLGVAGVVALIVDRVYAIRLPQTVTTPAVTIQRISTPRLHSHDTSGSTGTAHPRVQIDAWAGTAASAKAVTDQVRAALNGYRGTVTVGTKTVIIQAALINDERASFEPDSGLYRTSADYVVWHTE
jgi:hypothetical protein